MLLPAEDQALLTEAQRLAAVVQRRKTIIRHEREALGRDKAALDRLESECRARGIHLIRQPVGAGDIHGRHD